MATTMPGAPSRGRGRGRQIPPLYIAAGAGGIFVLYYLYSSSKKKAAAAAAATAAAASPTNAAATAPVVPAGNYGTGQNAGALANIEQQLASLQSAQATTTGAAAATATGSGVASTSSALTPSTSNESLTGSGYLPNASNAGGYATQVQGLNGHTYQWVLPAQAQAIGWNNLYYQPIPGVFMPNSAGTNLAPSTPLYAQVV